MKMKYNFENDEFRFENDQSTETTLGLKMNTQTEKNLDFLKAAHQLMEITGKRFFQPWIQPKVLFRMSKYYTKFNKSVNKLATLVDEVRTRIIVYCCVGNMLRINFRRRSSQRRRENTF